MSLATGRYLSHVVEIVVPESPFAELRASEEQHPRLPLSGLGILSICIGLTVPVFVGFGYSLVLFGKQPPSDETEVAADPALSGYFVVALGCCYGLVLAPVGALVGVCGLLQSNRRRLPVLVGIAINMTTVAILYLGGNPFGWSIR
jgi:hypothetical protein